MSWERFGADHSVFRSQRSLVLTADGCWLAWCACCGLHVFREPTSSPVESYSLIAPRLVCPCGRAFDLSKKAPAGTEINPAVFACFARLPSGVTFPRGNWPC